MSKKSFDLFRQVHALAEKSAKLFLQAGPPLKNGFKIKKPTALRLWDNLLFPCLHLNAIAYQRESLGTQIPNIPATKKTSVTGFEFVGFGDLERTRTVDLQRDRLAC